LCGRLSNVVHVLIAFNRTSVILIDFVDVCPTLYMSLSLSTERQSSQLPHAGTYTGMYARPYTRIFMVYLHS